MLGQSSTVNKLNISPLLSSNTVNPALLDQGWRLTHLLEKEREREEIMIVVTGAEHDTDRLDQSMTVNGYDLVSIE